MSDSAGITPTSASGYIFRASITLPNGMVIYAKQFGKRAFKIPVGPDHEAKKLES